MALRTITLTGTTIGSDISTVDIYGTSVTPGNLITSSITSQSLADGFTFQADETIYTFQLVTDSVCAVTQSVALTQAPVGSWAPIGTDGPTSSSFTTIGGEIISESLGDLAYSFDESTWMVVPTYRDITEFTSYVFTSVDNGLTWLKESNSFGYQWRGIVDAIGSTFFGISLYENGTTARTIYTSDAGNTLNSAQTADTDQYCFFAPNENQNCTKIIGITDKNANDWHVYVGSRSTYVHTYDCTTNGAWTYPTTRAAQTTGCTIGTSTSGNSHYATAGAMCSTSTSNTVNQYISFGNRYNLPCNLGCHLNADQLSIPAAEQGYAHQSMGSIENYDSSVNPTYGAFDTAVFIGQTGGHISRGLRNTATVGNITSKWTWDTRDSGDTNTNFTISAIAGSSGSAANPKGEVLAAAINTSTNSAGYFITSSDLGESWSQYTAPDLGEGVINHLIHDGTKYIGVGYSGSEGRFYQSRGDCISNSWIEATTCAPVYKTMYANGVYLSVGDYGSIYRGV